MLDCGCAFEIHKTDGTICVCRNRRLLNQRLIFWKRDGAGRLAFTAVDLEPRKKGEKCGDWLMRRIVGSFIWVLTMTKLDVMVNTIVRAVARRACGPVKSHSKVVRKIFAYLSGKKKLGITCRREGLD